MGSQPHPFFAFLIQGRNRALQGECWEPRPAMEERGEDAREREKGGARSNTVGFITSGIDVFAHHCANAQGRHSAVVKGIWMGTYRVKFVRREEVALGTLAFHFEKPAGFQFKPGQYADVILINPPEKDDEGIARSLSIASAPFEEGLMFATRMRNTAFKHVLNAMPPGAEVEMEGPYGSFTLHHNASRPAIMIAGGIGITPFRSMLIEAAHGRLPHRMILFYCNRRPEDAAFLTELQELQQLDGNFTLVGVMSKPDESRLRWEGEKGRLTPEILAKYSQGLREPIYYLVGPPAMVSDVHRMMNEAGVNVDDIRSEEFGGY